MQPPADRFEAETFQLQGEGVTLTYAARQGARPLRRMTLVDRDGERRFYQGRDIAVDETRAGTMVTVITGFAFDGDTRLLSVLLPDVNLDREPTAAVETVAIRSVHRGHIGGPSFIDGALSTYEAVALTGTARRGDRWRCADWNAWYDEMPGPGRDPGAELHVSAQCAFESGSITWTLEPANEGVVDDPKRFVLRLTVTDPGAGTDDFVEQPIHWSGRVEPGIEVVEIRGDASVEIPVTSAS